MTSFTELKKRTRRLEEDNSNSFFVCFEDAAGNITPPLPKTAKRIVIFDEEDKKIM